MELPAESTEVSTTAFMKAAAMARPARSKTSVKGLAAMFSSEALRRLGSV